MPAREASASSVRARWVIVTLVISGHVVLLASLNSYPDRKSDTRDEEQGALSFVDIPDRSPAPHPQVAEQFSPRFESPRFEAPPSITLPDETGGTTAGADWHASADAAAARAAQAPTTRDFGFPRPGPEPPKKKEFGWDKTHTERVSALEGGGIAIRLSENCAITFAPLPLGGCALGKRKAHGDLFDGMKAPAQPGDWKDP